MPDVLGSGARFQGREETVELLRRRFDDARTGGGGVTFLIGSTGVGKSTLVGELVGEVRARGSLVLLGRAPSLGDPLPFALIRSAIETSRDEAGGRSAGELPFGGADTLIGFAPRLGDDAFSHPVSPESRLLEALGEAQERSGSARDQALDGIVEQFLEFTRRGPTVLVLEDLHRADTASLSAVEFLAREMRNQPLWILATSRPYASLSEPSRARLAEFERAVQAQQLTLRPLTSAEVADYLRAIDPSREFSDAEVARLHSETAGNPLLLRQLGQASSSGVGLRGRAEPGRSPVDEEGRRVLELAAVLGPEFPFALLLQASGADEEHLTEVLDQLVDRALLYERTGEVLEFPEERGREEVYNLLDERRRRLYHQRAGATLEG